MHSAFAVMLHSTLRALAYNPHSIYRQNQGWTVMRPGGFFGGGGALGGVLVAKGIFVWVSGRLDAYGLPTHPLCTRTLSSLDFRGRTKKASG